MSTDHNRWIIATHKYKEHRSFDTMQAELDRLQQQFPKRKFRVYRIKQVVEDIVDTQPSQSLS